MIMNSFIVAILSVWQLAVGVLGNDVKRFGPGNGFMCHCKESNEQCDKESGQCVSGCATAWFGPGCQYRDLAQMNDTEVSQTSGYGSSKAIKAVDGNETTCSRTRTQPNPQWKIRLPHNETITELYIQTKMSSLNHFSHIRVFIEYNETNNQILPELCFSDDTGPPQNTSFNIKCVAPMTGNQVRIELGQQDQQARLVLCDIRINGGRNLAFYKPTNQSSTLYHYDRYTSSNAVDGDLNTCSWTENSGVQVWMLKLGHVALLQHVRFTTYSGGYKKAYEAHLFDSSNTAVHTWEDQDGDSQQTVYEEATSIDIRPKGRDSVIMCEVELFGDCTESYCGFDCKTECHCKDVSVWDRMSAICSSDQGKGCGYNQYGENCSKQCSIHCTRKYLPRTCNATDGSCLHGCQPGWRTSTCNEACPYPKYGNRCTRTCSSYCKDNKCNHVDGKCERGCNAGWQGDMCLYACKDGTYEDQCSGSCSKHCIKFACNKVNGHCVGGCKDGWQGDMCDEECSPGIYGAQCRNHCSNNCIQKKCNHIDGKCEHGCKDGWLGDMCENACPYPKYGYRCTRTCSTHCKDNKCNHIDGKCERGCNAGWQGDICQYPCPYPKYGNRCTRICSSYCKNNKCNHIDGKCERGCNAGWQGDICQYPCKDGTYGDQCIRSCSKQCKRYACDKVTGHCIGGCSDGWQGDTCEEACSAGTYGAGCQQHCSDYCKFGQTFCNYISGECEYGCVDGWQDRLCRRKCSFGTYGAQCKSHCSKNCKQTKCNHIDGTCEHGCKDGWFGDLCENICEAGKWGSGCGHTCGNCSDGTCHPKVGSCSGGCSIGFKYTPKCDKECDAGFYGINCSDTCGQCNNGSACNKITGVCSDGCITGYTGNLCIQVLEKADCNQTITIMGGVLGTIIAVLIVYSVFITVTSNKQRINCVDKNKTKPKGEDDHNVYVNERRKPKDQDEDTMTSGQNDQNYEEINTADIDDGTYETVDM